MVLSILKKYIWVINLALLAGVSYSVAGLINNNIAQSIYPLEFQAGQTQDSVAANRRHAYRSSRRKSKQTYDVIMDRNLFGVEDPFGSNGGPLGQGVNAPRSTLRVELLATSIRVAREEQSETGMMLITKERKSKAVIKNLDTGKIKSYTEGDKIDIITNESVKLLQIESCRAVIRRPTGREAIECKKDLNTKSVVNVATRPLRNPGFKSLSKHEGVVRIDKDHFEVDRKLLDEKLSNLGTLLSEIRVIPEEDGLKFVKVTRGSLFNSIGIRRGDILHRINSVELSNVTNLEDALSVFEELRGQDNFTLDITRRSKKYTFKYTVK